MGRERILKRKDENRILAMLSTAHSLNHSLFIVLPIYLTQVANEFGTTREIIGLVAAASGFLYGAGSLVGGSLSDKFGEIKTITLSLMFAGLSTLLFLIAHDLLLFTISMLIMSAGASLYHPTANSVISRIFQTNMAEAMGIHGTGGNIGYMFAPLITVTLGDLWGWRSPLVFFGLLSTLVATLFLKTPRISIKENQSKVKVKEVIKVQGLSMLIVYNAMVGLYFKGVDFIFPSFIDDRFALVFFKETVSTLKGLALFGILAIGILGQWLGGKASDKFSSRKALITTSFFVSLSLFLLPTVHEPFVAISLFVLLYGIFFYAHQPALNSLAAIITPDAMRGTMYGILFFFSFGLGSASTAIAASMTERYSLNIAFYTLTVFSLAALLISFLVPANRSVRNNNEKGDGQ